MTKLMIKKSSKKSILQLECELCAQKGLDDISFNDISAFKCSNCGYVSKKKISIDYQNLGKNEFKVFFSDRSKEASEITKIIKKEIKKEIISIVEIGSGVGSLLNALQKKKFLVYGFEPSYSAYKMAQVNFKFNDNLVNSYFEKTDFCQKADVFLLYDVVEHLTIGALFELLTKIKETMNNNSMLIIKTGDTQSLFARHEIRKWHYFLLKQHISFFNKKNLTILCKKLNLKIVTFLKFRHAYGGFAILAFIKNLIKLSILYLLPQHENGLKKLTFHLCNDHFIAIIRKS